MVKKFLVLLALTGSLAAAACNTVRGMGDDLQSASNAVDDET